MMDVVGQGFVLFCVLSIAESLDPCNPNGHRRIPNEGYRYVNFMITPDETPNHDSRLLESWYYVGNDKMPEKPPDNLFACGTKFPIWLNGQHPTDDKEVAMKACLMNLRDTCSLTYDVKIKFCKQKGFYLYYLKPTADTTEGYCFGTGIKGSATSYVSTKPTVSIEMNNTSIRNLPASSVYFKCDFAVKPLDTLWYRVSWWRENKLWYTTGYAQERTNATLYLTETIFVSKGFRLGENIACSVRAFEMKLGPPGKPSETSDAIFVGIQILTPSLSFTNGEKDLSRRTIRLKSTVPLGCSGTDHCSIWLTSYTNASGFDNCIGIVLEKTSCGVSIDSKTYDAELHIPVTTAETGQYQTKDGSYDIYLRTYTSQESEIWSNYQLPPIKVLVSILKTSYPGKKCFAVADPHMRTFDGLTFDNHQDGVYTLYKHTKFDAEIQIQHQKCNGEHIRCPCGVAARAGLDRYVVSFCDGKMDIDYKACVGDRSIVVKSTNMFHYKIVLPHGTYVDVSIIEEPYGINIKGAKRAVNVYVFPSIHDDKGASLGLCGKLDNDNCLNDIHHKDGTTIPTEAAACGSTTSPLTFIREWRIMSDGENLFHDNYNAQADQPWSFEICSCVKPDDAGGKKDLKNEIPCNVNTVAECTRGKVVNSNSCVHPVRHRRSVRGNAVKPTVHIPQAPTSLRTKRQASTNWTEIDARSYCHDHMKRSPVFDLCGKVPNAMPNETVETCVMDILLTNGPAWTSMAVDSMRGSCLSELERNTTLREKTGSQQSIAEIIEDKACSNNCSGVGECLKGKCHCADGFGGVDCSMDMSIGPTISGLLDHGLCDEQQLECDHAYVFGHVFTDDTNLTCRLEEFTITFEGVRKYGNTHYLPGEFETLIEVNCALRRVRSKRSTASSNGNNDFVFGYTISVSNDGNHFKDGHDLFVYTSECQRVTNISGTIHFTLMDGYCFIENKCVLDGSRNANNNCSVCRSDSSAQAWSLDSSRTGCMNITQEKINNNAKPKYLWIIGVVGGAVAGAIIAGVVFVKLTKKRAKKVGDSTILQAPNEDMNNPHSSPSNTTFVRN